jgi:hypothetical protein
MNRANNNIDDYNDDDNNDYDDDRLARVVTQLRSLLSFTAATCCHTSQCVSTVGIGYVCIGSPCCYDIGSTCTCPNSPQPGTCRKCDNCDVGEVTITELGLVGTPACPALALGCTGIVCHNGGSCAGPSYARYCICPACYTGYTCDDDFSECASNPCQNKGQCNEGFCGYNCSCLQVDNMSFPINLKIF